LYVTGDVVSGKKSVEAIPERRQPEEIRKTMKTETPKTGDKEFSYPVWRCKVCGYLCARDNPPEVCPICKAKKDRFERFA
jgi:ferredoxin-thioredoxin reductase catalytic chain